MNLAARRHKHVFAIISCRFYLKCTQIFLQWSREEGGGVNESSCYDFQLQKRKASLFVSNG